MKINKVIQDGKVAVLYSPEYGAGWSTWADDKYREFMVMDSGLVELAQRGASDEEVTEYLETVFGEDAHIHLGDWSNIHVEWVEQGAKFIISEYDGNESVEIIGDDYFMTA